MASAQASVYSDGCLPVQSMSDSSFLCWALLLGPGSLHSCSAYFKRDAHVGCMHS